MPSVQPYEAWFFYAADDVDEIDVEYERINQVWQPEPRMLLQPSMTEPVTVVACETVQGIDRVWFLRDGQLERRDSWMVRKH